jgi:hypothetical protein
LLRHVRRQEVLRRQRVAHTDAPHARKATQGMGTAPLPWGLTGLWHAPLPTLPWLHALEVGGIHRLAGARLVSLSILLLRHVERRTTPKRGELVDWV